MRSAHIPTSPRLLTVMAHHPAAEGANEPDHAQCRICFDGPDPTLGRLIRPCLCSGSVSHVHVACLQRWRNTSSNSSAFFVCPQCHYHYRFARTKIVGLATNPVAIATLSTILFTAIVFASSFFATAVLSSLDEPSYDSYGSSPIYLTTGWGYWTWTNPYSVGRDLVRAALRIIQDETGGIFDPEVLSLSTTPDRAEALSDRGILWRFVRRFILGLPVVGAASLVHMLFSLPFLGPLQWIARSRGNRGRRSSGSRDTVAVVIVILLAVGALRVVYQVYKLTESVTKRVLLRAEESILEVNG
ncbi:hypothetical protein B0F90DRAFT_79552 [Multifurca ochricompacta]|uniref:RING-CH-type domain-containing protein n=1 Tax=Multifurca ochricompacta TaxID=376703 RepID=A0AAD4MCK9_9AGAM|nr:hypothetical protein B0F90DRAFT_79552 [Multifurca ochricompacta]